MIPIENLQDFPPLGSNSVQSKLCPPTSDLKDSNDKGKEVVVDECLENGSGLRHIYPPSSGHNLNFFSPMVEDEEIVVIPPADVLNEGLDLIQSLVIAQFIVKIPNLSYFQRMVKLLWGSEGDVEVFSARNNLFIIQFPSVTVRDKILESGPWHINNQPLILRKWVRGIKALEFNMSKVPIWLHLHDVPLELFTQRGLSYIASAIGYPLCMDKYTAMRERFAFAKVCVEVDASKTIPRSISIDVGTGTQVSVEVETL